MQRCMHGCANLASLLTSHSHHTRIPRRRATRGCVLNRWCALHVQHVSGYWSGDVTTGKQCAASMCVTVTVRWSATVEHVHAVTQGGRRKSWGGRFQQERQFGAPCSNANHSRAPGRLVMVRPPLLHFAISFCPNTWFFGLFVEDQSPPHSGLAPELMQPWWPLPPPCCHSVCHRLVGHRSVGHCCTS